MPLAPISLDARGKPLQQAVHWADLEVFTTKAHFYYDTHPPSLRIKAIKREDAGLYRCRVDFQKSPTRNWRINLSVLGKCSFSACRRPPNKPVLIKRKHNHTSHPRTSASNPTGHTRPHGRHPHGGLDRSVSRGQQHKHHLSVERRHSGAARVLVA